MLRLLCRHVTVLSSSANHGSSVSPSRLRPSCGQVFQSKDAPDKTTTPEEFIRMTKGITTATAKAVAAGNSAQQEDVIATANLSRKAISDMLTTCKVLIQRRLARTALARGRLLPESAPCWVQIGHESAGAILLLLPLVVAEFFFSRRSLFKVTQQSTSQNVLQKGSCDEMLIRK